MAGLDKRTSLPPRNRRGKESQMEPYAAEICDWYKIYSLANIKDLLQEKYNLEITRSAIAKFINRRKDYAESLTSSPEKPESYSQDKPVKAKVDDVVPVTVTNNSKPDVEIPKFEKKVFKHACQAGGDPDILK